MGKNTQTKKKQKGKADAARMYNDSLPTMEPRFSGRIFSKLNPHIEVAILSLAIALTAVVLYYSNLSNNIVYCDDNIFIERFTKDIPLKTTLDTTIGTTFYRPVLNASFIIDAKSATKDGMDLSKLPQINDSQQLDKYINPEIYHRTSLLFHIAGSILILLAMIMLRFPVVHSFILSLIFTVHPLLTPAVSWISGRNDSMITVFILLSFIFFIAYIETKKNSRSAIYLSLHMIFFLVSLFTKEIGIVFPVLCLMYIPYAMLYKHDRSTLKLRTQIAVPLWAAGGIVWYMLRKAAMAKIDSPDEIGLDALIKNFNSIPAMIGKIFIPYKMIALSSFEAFSIITGWLFILAIIGAFVYLMKHSEPNESLRNSYKVLWGFAWFVVLLLPTLMIRIQYVDDFFDYAEHRAYLPMFGILVIVSQLLVFFKVNFKKAVPLILGLLVFLIFGAKSWTYKESFHDRFSFWSKMIEMYPDKSRGYYDMALAYKTNQQYPQADSLFMEAIKRNPENKKIYYQLFDMYDKTGKYEKVEEYARKLFKYLPEDHIGNYFLGKSLFNRGRKAEAIPYIEKAIAMCRNLKPPNNLVPPPWAILLAASYTYNNQIKPSIAILDKVLAKTRIPDAILYQGMNYYIQGDSAGAKDYFNQALSVQPELYIQLMEFYNKRGNYNEVKRIAAKGEQLKQPPMYYYFLVSAYINTQEYDKARELLDKGIGQYPGEKNLVMLSGELSYKMNDTKTALACFEKALSLNQNDPEIWYFIGNTYALTDNGQKAHEAFDRCLSLNPNHGNALNSDAALYYKEKNFPKAESQWLRSLQVAPKDFGSYINLIKFYRIRNNKEGAVRIAQDLKKNGGELPPELNDIMNKQ